MAYSLVRERARGRIFVARDYGERKPVFALPEKLGGKRGERRGDSAFSHFFILVDQLFLSFKAERGDCLRKLESEGRN